MTADDAIDVTFKPGSGPPLRYSWRPTEEGYVFVKSVHNGCQWVEQERYPVELVDVELATAVGR